MAELRFTWFGSLVRAYLKGRWRLGVGGLFVFEGRDLAKMSGGGWLEAFVSDCYFWFYFVSGEIRKRDMMLARSLDVRAFILIPVSCLES
mgnify:CR=1 FL=1